MQGNDLPRAGLTEWSGANRGLRNVGERNQ